MTKKVKIHIGEYYASNNPLIIYTILGSCVAVCFFDPVKRVGGMNHILLPGKADLRSFNSEASYGINAMELLINRILRLGGERRRLEAKVFGGAHIISAISKENGMGKKNSGFAIEFLINENIKIVSSDLGGTESRRIFFHTNTGEVFLKRIPSMLQTCIVRDEALKFKLLKKDTYKTGEITLFHD